MGAFMKTATKAMTQAATAAVQPPKAAKPKPAKSKPAAKPRAAAPRFETGTHTCAHGTRKYRVYLPSAIGAGVPLPLLVMLHGCGQTPEDFAKGTGMNALAEQRGVIVVYPAQPREAHANRCWNWFRPEDQGRDGGEPALLASLTRDMLARYGADPARVYVAGLSAGGSTAMLLAHAYPDLFAAVGCHSGLPPGAAGDKTSAIIAMKQGSPGRRLATPVPTIIFHGSDDHIVTPRNGRFVAIRAVETFPGLRAVELTRTVPGGRAYVRTSHRVGQGRSWVEHWLVKGAGHAWPTGPRARRGPPRRPETQEREGGAQMPTSCQTLSPPEQVLTGPLHGSYALAPSFLARWALFWYRKEDGRHVAVPPVVRLGMAVAYSASAAS